MNKPLLAFYGDDFTGSTDALEFVSRAGMKAALFTEPPTLEQLAAYPDLDAFGVAGITRSLSPQAMEKVLEPAFRQLHGSGARHVHYKVCSTFDSSPTVGSIGKAIDVAAAIFQNRFVPLLVAAPPLGRYCLFGNLFARMGIGSQGKIYRLDRHPSMRCHPVTPSDESDLRLHLGKQTGKQTGLLDILQIAKTKTEIDGQLNKLVQEGSEIILLDALNEAHLLALGALIDAEAVHQSPQFSVGSSGIEMALGKYWQEQGIIQSVQSWPRLGKAMPLLVLCGSCSPVTTSQIDWAMANGFAEVEIDPQAIVQNRDDLMEAYCREAIEQLRGQHHVIVHTGGSKKQALIAGEILGTALGSMGRKICEQVKISRIVVAGGDTSGYATRALGIEAVEMVAPLVPGAPICSAHAPDSPVDGIEINFKGGQVGGEDYFGLLASPFSNGRN